MTDTTHTLQLLKAKIEGRIEILEDNKKEFLENRMYYEASKAKEKSDTLQSVLDDIKELLNGKEE